MKLHALRRFEVFKDYRATNFVYNILNVEQVEIDYSKTLVFLRAELRTQFNRASVNNKGKNIVNTYDNQKYLINIYVHIVTR